MTAYYAGDKNLLCFDEWAGQTGCEEAMASKKHRKRKKKARQQAARPRNVDFLALPTGYIARQGRFVQVTNDASPEEHAEFRDSVLASQPDFEERVSANRQKLVEILEAVDPADLVARASLIYLNFDPNTYCEGEDDRLPSHIEYLALQALASGMDSPPTVDPVEASHLTHEAIELVRSLFFDSKMLLVIQALNERDSQSEPITDFQLRERMNSLWVRGTGYAEHLERVIAGCFTPLDELCKRVLGFTASDALAIYAGATELIASRCNERIVQVQEFHREMNRELKRARRSGTSDMFPGWVLELPPSEAKIHIAASVQLWIFIDSRSLAVFTAEEVADVVGLSPEVVESFLEAFVCEPSDFDPEHHELPSGAHPLTSKPVLRVEGGYLIPVPHTMLDAIRPRMEDLLRMDGGAWEKYVHHRGRFVEEEATRLLADAFPGSRSWTGLEWSSDVDQSDLDALVDWGDIAVRVQCKSGRVTAPVRRGAPRRMLDELGKLIGEAAEQHSRLARALEQDAPTALGFADDTSRAILLPLQIEAIVTLDEVATWATQARELQGLQVLPTDRSIPWILSLTDLMAVVDLLDGASLAHYLIRRQRLERDGRIGTHDELDWVGNYIFEGLIFDSFFEGEDPLTELRLMSHTKDIDAWYYTRQGNGKENPVPKPSQAIPESLALLLGRLAKERPANWLIASIALLDGDDESRNLWANGVERIRSRAHSEGWSDTTQIFDGRLGITLLADYLDPPGTVRRLAREYSHQKASQHDLGNWIVIGEGSDHKLFVLVQAERSTSDIFESFLAPQVCPQQSDTQLH